MGLREATKEGPLGRGVNKIICGALIKYLSVPSAGISTTVAAMLSTRTSLPYYSLAGRILVS